MYLRQIFPDGTYRQEKVTPWRWLLVKLRERQAQAQADEDRYGNDIGIM